MKKKNGISIKYKLLCLLVLLPVISLVLYLSLVIKLFEDDKIAYVFDSNAAVSRTLASQVDAEVTAALAGLQPIAEGYLERERQSSGARETVRSLAQTKLKTISKPTSDSQDDSRPSPSGVFSAVAQATFTKSEKMKWIGVYYPDSKGSFHQQLELTKAKPESSSLQEKLSEKWANELIAQACAQGFSFNSAQDGSEERSGMIYMSLCLNAKDLALQRGVIGLLQAPALAQAFKKQGNSSNFLVNAEGLEIFGPAILSSGERQNFSDWAFFTAAKLKKLPTGTTEARSPAGKEVLASYAMLTSGGFYVVSLMDKAKALAAVQILLSKSVLFFLALISAAVIVSVFASNGLTGALRELVEATRKISQGQFDVALHIKSNDEVGNLAGSFKRMAIEVSRLMMENIAKARMEKELETAKLVQETLFPKPVSKIGPLEIAGFYEPASECGGDWWHYCEMGNQVFLWIGDVTGHGAPAALITSAAKSAASIIEGLPSITPALAMGMLNRAIFSTSSGKMQMTFFIAALNKETGELVYCNASHNSPFLIRSADGVATKESLLTLDGVTNPRLGESEASTYQDSSLQLGAKDRILFYTDGVMDLADLSGKSWGERKFVKSLLEAVKSSDAAEGVISKVRYDANDFRKGTALVDDVTVFMCQFDGALT